MITGQGNQHARRRGWFSKQQPAPDVEIAEAAVAAIRERDTATLRTAARALAGRGHTKLARDLRGLARQLAILIALEHAGCRITTEQLGALFAEQ